MNKNSPSFGGNPRLLIQYGCAFFLHFGKCSVYIVHFQADVMEAFAALLEELRQAGIGCGWLNQFDLAVAWSAHGEESNAYLFCGHLFYFVRCYTECVTIKGQRLLDVAHDDGNVVNTFGHRYLLGTMRPC